MILHLLISLESSIVKKICFEKTTLITPLFGNRYIVWLDLRIWTSVLNYDFRLWKSRIWWSKIVPYPTYFPWHSWRGLQEHWGGAPSSTMLIVKRRFTKKSMSVWMIKNHRPNFSRRIAHCLHLWRLFAQSASTVLNGAVYAGLNWAFRVCSCAAIISASLLSLKSDVLSQRYDISRSATFSICLWYSPCSFFFLPCSDSYHV